MRHWLSNTIVGQRFGSNDFQVRPDPLGLPVRAKVAHAVAIYFRQLLRLRRVAGALFAAFGVVGDGRGGRVQFGQFHFLQGADIVRPQTEFDHHRLGKLTGLLGAGRF